MQESRYREGQGGAQTQRQERREGESERTKEPSLQTKKDQETNPRDPCPLQGHCPGWHTTQARVLSAFQGTRPVGGRTPFSFSLGNTQH